MRIEERLLAVFRGVFDCELDELSDDASPESIPGWDSVNHVNLVISLEAEFGVQFEADEIAELTSVSAIRQRLRAS